MHDGLARAHPSRHLSDDRVGSMMASFSLSVELAVVHQLASATLGIHSDASSPTPTGSPPFGRLALLLFVHYCCCCGEVVDDASEGVNHHPTTTTTITSPQQQHH
eukprot:scaffold34617_cov193-Skeletonema_dohrnii-CCMP3373.AAC.1